MEKPEQTNLEVSVTVRGELFSKSGIKILKGGEAIGLVSGKEVVVEGVVKGRILADEEIIVTKGGQVEGEVEATALSVEKGAHYRGKCRIGFQENFTEEKIVEPTSSTQVEAMPKRWFWQR